MNKSFAKATGLAHNLRNRPTWDELWASEDPRDRDACFDGEEGVDFAAENNVVMLCPKKAAEAAQPFRAATTKQQNQVVKSVTDLEAQYIQQQQQQPQML